MGNGHDPEVVVRFLCKPSEETQYWNKKNFLLLMSIFNFCFRVAYRVFKLSMEALVAIDTNLMAL